MQPIGLCFASHKYHVAACQRHLDGRGLQVCLTRFPRLVLQQEITAGSEREGCDSWIRAKESLIIAVKRDAVASRSIVIDQTKVVLCVGIGLGHASQKIEAFGNWSRFTLVLGLGGTLLPSILASTSRLPANDKAACFIDTKDSRIPWSVNQGVLAESINGVFHAVEEELCSEKLKEISLNRFRKEWLKVEQVQMRLIVDEFSPETVTCTSTSLCNVRWKMNDWPRICSMSELSLRGHRRWTDWTSRPCPDVVA